MKRRNFIACLLVFIIFHKHLKIKQSKKKLKLMKKINQTIWILDTEDLA